VAEFKLGMRSWSDKRIYEERGKCPRTSGGDVQGFMLGWRCPFPGLRTGLGSVLAYFLLGIRIKRQDKYKRVRGFL